VWELLLVAENSPALACALMVSGGLAMIIEWLLRGLAGSPDMDLW